MNIAHFNTFIQNFAKGKKVSVTMAKGTFEGTLQRIDGNNNLYIITQTGHAFFQFKYLVALNVIEKEVVKNG